MKVIAAPITVFNLYKIDAKQEKEFINLYDTATVATIMCVTIGVVSAASYSPLD